LEKGERGFGAVLGDGVVPDERVREGRADFIVARFLVRREVTPGVANFFVSVPVGVVIEVAKISRAFAFVLFRVGKFAGVG
jgi:hypothetical protein